MSEALLSPRRQIVSLFHPAFTPTRRRYCGSKGEMTATAAILVGQNRTNYPRLCHSRLIEGQNWRYSPQMTRNDGNGRQVWAQSGPLPKRDATGAARRAATRIVGDRGRERPVDWNATGGRQRPGDWIATGAGKRPGAGNDPRIGTRPGPRKTGGQAAATGRKMPPWPAASGVARRWRLGLATWGQSLSLTALLLAFTLTEVRYVVGFFLRARDEGM